MKEYEFRASRINKYDANIQRLKVLKMMLDPYMQIVMIMCTFPTSWDTLPNDTMYKLT